VPSVSAAVNSRSMRSTIAITANGRRHELPAGQTLDAFLASLGQQPKQVVVEHNGEALTPNEARATTLTDGDILEIVRIVAGG
jgi:sulfur carrier protein